MSYTLNAPRMEFSWSEFLAGNAVATVVQEVIAYRKRKKEATFNLTENVADIAQIYTSMEEITNTTRYKQFMILKGEDSAGILAAGKKLYITAQYEKLCKTNESLSPIQHLIQRWEADHHYYRLFSDMLSNGVTIVRTEDLPPSKLKTLYIAQGVKYSEVGHLMTTKNSALVFYYSAAVLVGSEPDAEDESIKDGNVSIIKNIFQKHRKFY